MDKGISGKFADGILSIFCIAVGSWFLYESYHLPNVTNPSGIGPDGFPKYISSILIICGVFLLFIRKKTPPYIIKFKESTLIIKYSITIFFYLLLIEKIGFYLTSSIFVPILFIVSRTIKYKTIIALTISYILVAYLGFNLLLGVPLP